jgi:hypothetical protein
MMEESHPIFVIWIVVSLWLLYGITDTKLGRKIMSATTGAAAWASWKLDSKHEFLFTILALAVVFALMFSFHVLMDKNFRPWRAPTREEKLKIAIAKAKADISIAAIYLNDEELKAAIAEVKPNIFKAPLHPDNAVSDRDLSPSSAHVDSWYHREAQKYYPKSVRFTVGGENESETWFPSREGGIGQQGTVKCPHCRSEFEFAGSGEVGFLPPPTIQCETCHRTIFLR